MSLDMSELQIEDSNETATQSIEDSILPFEHEIECLRSLRRYYDTSSQFDRLCYLCEESSFSLYFELL
jgi:hypothetical protein